MPATQKLVQRIMEQAQKLEPNRKWAELSVVLMDDEGIAAVNADYLDKNKPTDVISFTYDPMPGENAEYAGEVIVNVQRAMEEGSSRGSANRELALYIAHGCLHLTGADDHTDEARAAMFAQQEQWLDDAEQRGLLQGLMDRPGNEQI